MKKKIFILPLMAFTFMSAFALSSNNASVPSVLAFDYCSVYTIAGQDALMGSDWDPADAANDMTDMGNGTFQLVKENVALSAGEYEYKAVGEHAWGNGECPESGNQSFTIEEDATYTITFNFTPATPCLTVDAVKTGDFPTPVYSYTTYENWQIKYGYEWEWSDNMEEVGDGLYKIEIYWEGTGFNVKSDENPIKKDWFEAGDPDFIIGEEVIPPVVVDVYLRVIDDETLKIGIGVEPSAPHVHAIKTTHSQVEAKCEEAGHKAYYECDCGKYFSDQALNEEIANLETWLGENGGGYITPLEGHNFGGTVTYTWNEDECIASWKCQRTGCDETQTEVASLDNGKTVYVMDTPATCLQNEKGHYEATFTTDLFVKQSTADNGVVKSDTALGHHFSGEITYTWEGDKCTASHKCDHAGCTETQTETVTGVYVKDSDATTESNEKGHYVATFSISEFATNSTAPNSIEIPDSKLSNKGLSGGAIAGIVIGSVFGLLIIAFVVLYILWKRKNLNAPLLCIVLTPAFRFINKLFFKTKLNDVEAKKAENKAMKE